MFYYFFRHRSWIFILHVWFLITNLYSEATSSMWNHSLWMESGKVKAFLVERYYVRRKGLNLGERIKQTSSSSPFEEIKFEQFSHCKLSHCKLFQTIANYFTGNVRLLSTSEFLKKDLKALLYSVINWTCLGQYRRNKITTSLYVCEIKYTIKNIYYTDVEKNNMLNR